PSNIPGTTSFYKLLDAFDLKIPDSIEAWCGGEYMDAGLAERLVEKYAVVRNFYGPTEATIWSTFHTVTLENLGSVGLPFGGTTVHAPGSTAHEPTELILTGRGLAAGYVRPADDDGRFVDLPGYGRAYRTGDLGHVAADGTVHVCGRIDDQVKVNGYRIELTDVDAALECHERVRHAAAFTTNSTDGTVQISAVYVADGTVPMREMRNHLRTVLPSYAMPRQLRQVEHLPLTTAGKVDRRLLRSGSERPVDR
ncbi:AMP-binding protein, partial [Nocardia sp. NPDC058497]|uniref:AMP-binding protein n=1 Tax=Nocardia sp. NPDC058497 TaxID=3346529 RepID=UPI003658285B